MQPEILMLGVALTALAIYAVFGGADFGAGIWELLGGRRADSREKELIYHAIGPVWEANHVWLIFVLMILWGGFPVAFSGICRITFIPLLLTLTGIVFRGAAYAFRSTVDETSPRRRVWESVFALASTMAPFFMGVTIAVLASDIPQLDAQGRFTGNPLIGWMSPGSLFFGAFAIGICAFLAAVFLNREAALSADARLGNLWRQRAMVTGLVTGGLAMAGLVVTWIFFPRLSTGLLQRGWPFVAASVVAGTATILLVQRQRNNWAAVTAATAVFCVILGFGAGQYPYLVAPNLTIAGTAAPANVLWLLLGCIAVGLVLILPPLWWLLQIFKAGDNRQQG